MYRLSKKEIDRYKMELNTLNLSKLELSSIISQSLPQVMLSPSMGFSPFGGWFSISISQ